MKRKICVILKVLFIILVFCILYKQYCIHKTREIRDDFVYTFEYMDRNMAEKNKITSSLEYLEYLVYEKQLGKKFTISINTWSVLLSINKGSIICDIEVTFFDDDDKVVFSDCLVSPNSIFYLIKSTAS